MWSRGTTIRVSKPSYSISTGRAEKPQSHEPLRQALGLDQPGIKYLFGALQLTFTTAALWSIPSIQVRVVLGIAIIVAATTALGGYVPSPLGHGRVFPNSHVKTLCILLFSPQEVLLGVGIGSLVGYYMLLPKSEAWWRAANNASAWGLSAGAASILAHLVLVELRPFYLSVPVATLVAMIIFRMINEGIWAVARGHFMRYSFFAEWGRGIFGRWGFQILDFPVVTAGTLVVHQTQSVQSALAAITVAAFLVPLARLELKRQYNQAVNNRMAALLGKNDTLPGPLVQYNPEGISLINAEGTIVYANLSASGVLGYDITEQVGRSWFEMCHPEDVARVKSLFTSLVSEPGSHNSIEARMVHKDGSWKWIHASQVNLLMEPSVRAVVVTYRDNTQGRRSEETLEQYAARLEELSRRLVQAQEAERRRIAHELHDETGQILTGLKLTLDAAIRQIGEGEGRAILERVASMVETLQNQVRYLSMNLRPAALDDLGLLPAVLMLGNQYERHMSVRVKIVHHGVSERRFASEVETTAYRVVQEGLTNIVRHAGVPDGTVRIWTDADVMGIQVEDRGKGFVANSDEFFAQSGGLSGMRERVLLVGGELTVESAPGIGTRLMVELPLGQSSFVQYAAEG